MLLRLAELEVANHQRPHPVECLHWFVAVATSVAASTTTITSAVRTALVALYQALSTLAALGTFRYIEASNTV